MRNPFKRRDGTIVLEVSRRLPPLADRHQVESAARRAGLDAQEMLAGLPGMSRKSLYEAMDRPEPDGSGFVPVGTMLGRAGTDGASVSIGVYESFASKERRVVIRVRGSARGLWRDEAYLEAALADVRDLSIGYAKGVW